MNPLSLLGQLGAPAWSLNLGEAGRTFVWSGVLFFVASTFLWVLSKQRHARLAFVLGSLCLFGTFGILATLFARNQFIFEYVWSHSDSRSSLPYRIAGVWAGQQGSFLLWACCAAVFGCLAVARTGVYERWFGSSYSVFLGTLCGILAYETPFKLNPEVPLEGSGLNPALQNYWVTIHPPVIFLGFGALTVPAALALAAMLVRNYDAWVPIVRPWAIVAMTLTGLGLAMGGFWAYETLGWGGFWMWDPVENTSFVPWVLIAAFLHGCIVQVTRKRWVASNLLMGGLPFISFVYGTFLTRSGMLSETSVHSFAQMDNVALKLLVGFFGGSALLFIGLWIVRAIQISRQPEKPAVQGWNREGFFRWGAMLLIGLGIATAIGMSMPMVMSLMGKPQKVVEEALYHRVLTWLFVPIMLAMAAGPLSGWKGMGTRALSMRLYGVVCTTLVLVGATMVFLSRTGWSPASTDRIAFPFGLQVPALPWLLLLIALCYAVVVANVWRAVELLKGAKLGLGAFLAHVGVSVMMLGLIVSRGLERKDEFVIQEGGQAVGLGHTVTYKGMTKDVNDRDNEVLFQVSGRDGSFTASPGFYLTHTPDGMVNPMVWPHIQRHALYDVYFTLHPRQTEASDAVTLNPGEKRALGDFNVTYLKMTRDGQPGAAGTKFGALLRIGDGPDAVTVNPQMMLSGESVKQLDVPLGGDLQITLKSIDPGSNAVTVQTLFTHPIYPIEMFFKPMTILVWLGTLILTVAGLMSAAYRWPKRLRETPKEEPTLERELQLA